MIAHYHKLIYLMPLALLTGPFFGAWSDNIGKRKLFINWFTLIIALSSLTLGLVAPSSLPKFPKIIVSLIMFFIIQSSYQLSLIFFNSLLDKISTKQNRGKISGIGEFFGMLGFLAGVVILLPIANSTISFLSGTTGRSQVFFPAAILFIIMSLPFIILFKEKTSKIVKSRQKINIKDVYTVFWSGLKRLVKKDKNVLRFLISFYFVSDALLTAQLFFAIYLAEVWKLADTAKTFLLLFLFIGILPGSIISGLLCHKYSVKKFLMWITGYTTVLFFSLVLFNGNLFYLHLLVLLIGFGWGSYYTVARTFFVNISPKNKLGEYFGFFSVFQKMASIVGPLIWSFALFLFSKSDVFKYKVAMFLLGIMMFIGLILLRKVKETVPAKISVQH